MLVIMAIAITVVSCKKDEIKVNETTTQNSNSGNGGNSDYTPLAIGNYWVYKNYEVDSLGNETEVQYLDSVVITHDTIINGNTYYIFEGTNYPLPQNWHYIKIVRDSGDYLVNEQGKILFSSNDFSNILSEKIEIYNTGDTIYYIQFKMEQVYNSVSLPAGVFNNVYNYQGTLIVPGSSLNPRYLDNYYAPGIGEIVKTNSFVSMPKMFKKKLLRYNVN